MGFEDYCLLGCAVVLIVIFMAALEELPPPIFEVV
jgi:hypothetical protein